MEKQTGVSIQRKVDIEDYILATIYNMGKNQIENILKSSVEAFLNKNLAAINEVLKINFGAKNNQTEEYLIAQQIANFVCKNIIDWSYSSDVETEFFKAKNKEEAFVFYERQFHQSFATIKSKNSTGSSVGVRKRG